MTRVSKLSIPVCLVMGLILGASAFVIFNWSPQVAYVCDESRESNYKRCDEHKITFIPFVRVAKFFDDHNGGFVAFFTLVLLAVSWRQAEISVRQEQLSKKVFKASRRPKLRIRGIAFDPKSGYAASPSDRKMAEGLFYVSNIGTCKAFVTSVGTWAEKFTELPMGASYVSRESNVDVPIGFQLEVGESGRFTFRVDVSLPFGAVAETEARSQPGTPARTFVMGWVNYRDAPDGEGIERTTAFCRVLDEKIGRYRVFEDPDYEHED